MSKGKGRLLPEGERPIEIVMGENIKRYFLLSNYVNLAAFAKDVKCGSKQLREVMSGEKTFSAPVLQRIAYLLNIKTIDLIEDWSEE